MLGKTDWTRTVIVTMCGQLSLLICLMTLNDVFYGQSCLFRIAVCLLWRKTAPGENLEGEFLPSNIAILGQN